jgi:hypothetical protein
MRARVWLWGLPVLLIALLWGIHVYTLVPLEQVITCDEFKHLPNGGWVTVKDVSLSYGSRISQYNSFYGKGTTITGTGDSEGAHLLDALNKVCATQ